MLLVKFFNKPTNFFTKMQTGAKKAVLTRETIKKQSETMETILLFPLRSYSHKDLRYMETIETINLLEVYIDFRDII
jgi:hypothetical protein